jgi:hypothetical protein
LYQLFDASLDSYLPLEGLPRSPARPADLIVRPGGEPLDESACQWLHTWRDASGATVLACARLDSGTGTPAYLLRFPGLADFTVSGPHITCSPAPDCQEATLRHLLCDQVIPRVWAQRGHLVMHASAVQLADGRVLAFAGDSGRGKSTLAAALVNRGAQLLDDDAIALVPSAQGVRVVPGYGGLRLNPDSLEALALGGPGWSSVAQYSGKRQRLPGEAPRAARGRLHGLYLLAEPDAASAPARVPLRGAGLLPTLLRHSFLLDVRDNAAARQQLALAAAVVQRVPEVCSLAYGRDYAVLPALCETLLRAAVPGPGMPSN